MSNIPVTARTHKTVKEMCIEVGYPLKISITQNNLLELMISKCTIEELIEEYKKLNGIETNSDISTDEMISIAEMTESDEE